MPEFVHLHLHTEFSLLDGACRIDELLDQAVALKMPAVAVTEHGNMFSSVIFHDHAKARGLKPILGCEVYVAPGDRRTKSGVPGETQNHLVLLAETDEGYHNLIKLVSAGYTEGFYYKPRIDKELLAQHATGLIGLSSCLKGEVAEGLWHQQERKAIEAAGAYRDIFGAGNFFLEMQWHGIEEQRLVNGGLPAIARDLGLPLICTNDVHYLREADAHPHDVLLCIGTGKAFSDPKRLRYDAKQFFLKTAAEMAEVFKDFPDALANTVRIAERCHVTLEEGKNYLPNFDVPPGFTLDGYFEHVAREGFVDRLQRLQQLASAGKLRHTIDEYRTAPVVRARHDQADGLSGLLPDRVGFHPLCARAGHSGRTGSRVGRRQPGRLLHAHHRRRPDRLRSDLRALLEPGARVDARHRHRFLRAAARRGHRLRHARSTAATRSPRSSRSGR